MKRRMLCVLAAALLLSLFPGCAEQAKAEPVSIVTATDLHFAGRDNYAYTGTYRQDSETNGSGKQMQYLDDILDAFIDQMLREKPDYILLTGDLTFIGAKSSHQALAQRLCALTDAGLQVLVVPGNHDICAGTYILPEGEPVEAPSVTPEQFREIYAEFGYTGGISYDEHSLSYVYDTGKGSWIFMLDTNFKYGSSLGQLSDGTIDWLKSQLKRCKRAGAYPLLAGHHNLLVHNERFKTGFVLGNSDQILPLAKRYGAGLYLSGHLHTQHIAREDKLTDIAGESFAVYPHRYGRLTVTGSQWSYEAQATDVAGYAKAAGKEDPNLLHYEDFGYGFFYDCFFNQAMERLSGLTGDEDILFRLCDLSARVNVCYFGGTPSAIDRSDEALLQEYAEGTSWGNYLKSILAAEDSIRCESGD